MALGLGARVAGMYNKARAAMPGRQQGLGLEGGSGTMGGYAQQAGQNLLGAMQRNPGTTGAVLGGTGAATTMAMLADAGINPEDLPEEVYDVLTDPRVSEEEKANLVNQFIGGIKQNMMGPEGTSQYGRHRFTLGPRV